MNHANEEKDAFSPELRMKLITRGHTMKEIEAIGLIEAIRADENGILHGAVDPRGDDHAAGW